MLTFAGIGNQLNIMTFFLLHIYIIFILLRFYNGIWYHKLILYGLFNICELIAEAPIFWAGALFYPELPGKLTELCYETAIFTVVVRIFIVLLVYLFFVRNEVASDQIIKIKEFLPILVMVLLMHIPILILCENREIVKQDRMVQTYMFCVQVILLMLSVYIIYMMYQNKRKVGIVEEKLKSANEIIELTSSVHELKHDMMFHVNVMLDLLYKEKYGEAKQYIENTFECVRILENTFSFEDPAITSSMNLIAQKAKDKQITFNHIITVNDFILASHEMCSLLLNILSNAMDAAEHVNLKRRIVCLEISLVDGGYHINCMNTYREKPVFKKGRIISSKLGEGHGKGISIIKNIVEKHGGAMNIVIHEESKIFEINCFIPGSVGEETRWKKNSTKY